MRDPSTGTTCVEGAEGLGVPLDDHIDFCIKAMQAKAEELGIKGSL